MLYISIQHFIATKQRETKIANARIYIGTIYVLLGGKSPITILLLTSSIIVVVSL